MDDLVKLLNPDYRYVYRITPYLKEVFYCTQLASLSKAADYYWTYVEYFGMNL